MVTQITKGIKISVLTSFEGTYFKNYRIHFAFSYQITIENQSKEILKKKVLPKNSLCHDFGMSFAITSLYIRYNFVISPLYIRYNSALTSLYTSLCPKYKM